jgi:hypothetical protein
MKYKFILFPVLSILGFIIWWRLVQPHELQFGAQAVPVEGNFLIVIYGYLVTLLGVVLGSGYRELQKLRESGATRIENMRAFFKNIFSSVDLWLGLFGSPIVYALLWKSVAGGNISGLTIIALQNGFCCTVIISNFVRRNEAGGQPPKQP